MVRAIITVPENSKDRSKYCLHSLYYIGTINKCTLKLLEI